MNIIKLELFKLFKRNSVKFSLLAASVILPALIISLSQLHAIKDKVPEGVFMNDASWATVAYTNFYFALPLFVIVFTSLELTKGHANRVCFIKSKKFYFLSKVAYCFLISLFFSAIGIVTLYITQKTAPYQLQVSFIFYSKFFFQLLLTNLCIALFLNSIIFLVKSPIITFVVFFVLSTAEVIIYTLIKGLYSIDLFYLPLHLMKLYFSRGGTGQMDSYYMPFDSFSWTYLLPPVFLVCMLSLAYLRFKKSDLPVLSD